MHSSTVRIRPAAPLNNALVSLRSANGSLNGSDRVSACDLLLECFLDLGWNRRTQNYPTCSLARANCAQQRVAIGIPNRRTNDRDYRAAIHAAGGTRLLQKQR